MSSFSSSKKNAVIGRLWTRIRKQTIIAFYFEFETVLMFYNLEASWLCSISPCNHITNIEGSGCFPYCIFFFCVCVWGVWSRDCLCSGDLFQY